MEDNIQRIFSILISVVLFFLLPLYMAFEKKDDISYALALKITTNFVDSVASKGYLSKKMYEDYITQLSTTGNSYDISFEHIAKKYYPVINVYENADYNTMKYTNLSSDYYDFNLYKSNYNSNQEDILNWMKNGKNQKIVFKSGSKINDKENLKLGYVLHEEKYYTDQILEILGGNTNNNISVEIDDEDYKKIEYSKIPSLVRLVEKNNIYTMNEGDQFTVIVRNKNTTIATILFNSLTFGANSGNDTKVYINYGGTIQNMEWVNNDFFEYNTLSSSSSE